LGGFFIVPAFKLTASRRAALARRVGHWRDKSQRAGKPIPTSRDCAGQKITVAFARRGVLGAVFLPAVISEPFSYLLLALTR